MLYRDLRLGLRDWEWTGVSGLSPRAARLEITGWPPAILRDVYVEPANDNLTLTGHAPVAGVSQFVAPGQDALTVTGHAPAPAPSEIVVPGADALTVTGYAPTVSGVSPTTVEPGNDTLVITGAAPTPRVDQVPAPANDTLVVTGYAPLAPASEVVTPGADTLSITEYAPTVETGNIDVTVSPDQDTLVITGLAPAVSVDIPVANDTLVVTGQTPLVSTDTLITIGGTETLTLTNTHNEVGVDSNTYVGPGSLRDLAWSACPIGDADDARIVVAAIGMRGDTTNVVSVTIGGVTATQVVEESIGADASAVIYAAAVPTGTTADIVMRIDDTVADQGISVYSMIGASGVAASDTATNADSFDDVTSLTLNVPQGGAAVAVAFYRDVTGAVTWTGLTEDYDAESTGSRVSTASSSDMSANASFEATSTGTLSTMGAVAAVWAPSSALGYDELTITGYAPDVSSGQIVAPGADSLEITEYAPTPVVSQVLAPGADSLIITEYAPSIAIDQFVAPGQDSLIITEYAPTVSTGGGGSTTHTRIYNGGQYNHANEDYWKYDHIYSTVQDGDLIIIVVADRGGASHTNHKAWDNQGSEASPNFTKIIGYDNEITDSNARHAVSVWYKIADATDEAANPYTAEGGSSSTYTCGMECFIYRPDAGTYNYNPIASAANGSGASPNDMLDTPPTATTGSVSGSDLFVLYNAVGRNNGGFAFSTTIDTHTPSSQEDQAWELNTHGAHFMSFYGAHNDNQTGGTTFSHTYETNNDGIEGTALVIVFEDGA